MKRDILVYNDGKYEKERIVAERWMRIIYENPVGRATLPFLVSRKALSRVYGAYCRTSHSARGIARFIEQNGVDMTGCADSYKSFADFFSREREGIVFPSDPGVLGSPCEGMVLAYDNIRPQQLVAAKGSTFSLPQLLGSNALAESYEGGCMVQIRLTPANYHRMHFFDDGIVRASKLLDGGLYSVSPLAVARIARLYCQNKRAVILFSSQNFGDVVLVEVGATFVGSIVHCFEDGERVKRGQQASYFLPGGSLVLAFFKKGAFRPNAALLERSATGRETKTPIGAPLG